jgi:DNA-binding Xre family transcriptional regulator
LKKLAVAEVQKLCEQFGDVRPRLDRLRLLAQYEWGRKVSYWDIARGVNLTPYTVGLLNRQDLRIYNLDAVRRLCWYFGCTPADLLERVQSAGSPYPVAGEPAVGRKAPPDSPLPRTLASAAPPLVNEIPHRLAPFEERALAEALRLNRSTVYRLQHTAGERIGRWTLAAVCTFLSRVEGRDVGVNELLVFPAAEPAFQAEETP